MQRYRRYGIVYDMTSRRNSSLVNVLAKKQTWGCPSWLGNSHQSRVNPESQTKRCRHQGCFPENWDDPRILRSGASHRSMSGRGSRDRQA
eukprot:1790044-Amphidinium_carterae.1